MLPFSVFTFYLFRDNIKLHSSDPWAECKHTYFTTNITGYISTIRAWNTQQLISYPCYVQNTPTTRPKFLNKYSSFGNFNCFHSLTSWTVWVNTWNRWTAICSPENHRWNWPTAGVCKVHRISSSSKCMIVWPTGNRWTESEYWKCSTSISFVLLNEIAIVFASFLFYLSFYLLLFFCMSFKKSDGIFHQND